MVTKNACARRLTTLLLALLFSAAAPAAAFASEASGAFSVAGDVRLESGEAAGEDFSVVVQNMAGAEVDSAEPGEDLTCTARVPRGWYVACWEVSTVGGSSASVEMRTETDPAVMTLGVSPDADFTRLTATAVCKEGAQLVLDVRGAEETESENLFQVTASGEDGLSVLGVVPGTATELRASFPEGWYAASWRLDADLPGITLEPSPEDPSLCLLKFAEGSAVPSRIPVTVAAAQGYAVRSAVLVDGMPSGNSALEPVLTGSDGLPAEGTPAGEPLTVRLPEVPDKYQWIGWTVYSPEGDDLKALGVDVEESGGDAGALVITIDPDSELSCLIVCARYLEAHSITALADPEDGGTVTADPDSAFMGESVSITAVPAEGYSLAGWYVDSEDKIFPVPDAEQISVQMPAADLVITAQFTNPAMTLKELIPEAEDLLVSVKVSDLAGRDVLAVYDWVPRAAYDQLAAAVADAEASWEEPEKDLAACVEALRTAMADFEAAILPGTAPPLALHLLSDGPGAKLLTGLDLAPVSGRGPEVCTILANLSWDAANTAVVTTADGQPVSPGDSTAATGMVLLELRPDGSVEDKVTMVVSGDVTGSGQMSLTQLTRMAAAYQGVWPLEGVYHMAGDLDGSGAITFDDLVAEAQMYLVYLSGGK